MAERTRKILLISIACCGLPALAIFAYARPAYFSAQSYVGWLLLFEFLILTVWLYREVFFPAIIAVFLFAGIDVPFQSLWTPARWGVLALGTLVG